MMRTALVLTAFALLSTGCVKRHIIPDPSIPHRLSKTVARAEVWVRAPDGKLVKTKVELPAGWWVASPQVVEAPE